MINWFVFFVMFEKDHFLCPQRIKIIVVEQYVAKAKATSFGLSFWEQLISLNSIQYVHFVDRGVRKYSSITPVVANSCIMCFQISVGDYSPPPPDI